MKLVRVIGACAVVVGIVGALPPATPALGTDASDKLQTQVADEHLIEQLERSLGGDFAGVWFDPAAARFHVGVARQASRHVVETSGIATRLATQSGVRDRTAISEVESTWAALAAAQTRWNRKLSKLPAGTHVMTGLDAEHNAVLVTLSSATPAPERAALERAANSSKVNIIIDVAPASRFQMKRTAECVSPFASNAAYCEKTLVSGVSIKRATKLCTAGPMLISGNETFMLTAGHCFGGMTAEAGEAIAEEVSSSYVAPVAQKEIGKEGKRYFTTAKDMAEVKIVQPGNFSTVLPTPVPALVTEWKENPKTPRSVTGETTNAKGQLNCHEGQTSGEQCGEVLAVNVTIKFGTETAEHVVEDTACGEGGDSGGPFFLGDKTPKSILMQGLLIVANVAKKCSEGEKGTWYEPLKDEGAEKFGVLSNFPGQELLTETNEKRPPTTFKVKGGVTKLETTKGTVVECEALSSEGGELSGVLGSLTMNLTNCKSTGVSCNTKGDAKGTILYSAGIHFVNFKKTELVLGIVVTPKETVSIECGGIIKVEVKGAVLGLADEVKSGAEVETMKLLFHQKKGEQELTECENDKEFCKGGPFKLEASFGKGFELAGEEAEATMTFAKKVTFSF